MTRHIVTRHVKKIGGFPLYFLCFSLILQRKHCENVIAMGNIKIIKGAFDTRLELIHASVAAGFPSPAEDYIHETLDFNRDFIKPPEASFYGDVDGDSMKD